MDKQQRALGQVKVMFWQCLVPEHAKRRNVVTVEWVGDTATCTAPGCDLTSEHTTKLLGLAKEVLIDRLEHPDTLAQVEAAIAAARPGKEGAAALAVARDTLR